MATQTPAIRFSPRDLEMADQPPAVSWWRLLAVGAGTVLASTIANVLVAQALAKVLQVPSVFTPLGTPAVAPSTVVGVSGAVVVFALLARFTRNPVRAFRVVATVGLVITWVPDLVIWSSRTFPDTTTAGILSLMSLHLVAAVVAIFLLGQYGLPPSRQGK